jgi:hypothetical protein
MGEDMTDPLNCELCGEGFLDERNPMAYQGMDERGEFAIRNEEELRRVEKSFRSERYSKGFQPGDNKVGDHLLAHASCGLGIELELA